MKSLKAPLAAIVITSITLAAMLATSGCAAQREQASHAAMVVGGIADEIELRRDDPIGDIVSTVQEELDRMATDGLLSAAEHQAAIDRLEQAIDQVDAALPSPELVDSIIAELRKGQVALQRVADAPDDATAIIEGLIGVSQVAAPLAGPYAPWVALGGALLGSLAGLITGNRHGQNSGRAAGQVAGVQAVALPIDDARLPNFEDELANAHPGRRFIVVDRDKVNKGHVLNGVATAIQMATSVPAMKGPSAA